MDCRTPGKRISVATMLFQKKLIQAKFIKRYKRFFADIEINGKTEVAHVPNTGSMKGCFEAGKKCWVSFHDDPKRKLKYTLEITESPDGTLVGVNTSNPNKLVREAWEKKLWPTWNKYTQCQSEVKISDDSRIDFVLWSDTKNVPAAGSLKFQNIQELIKSKIKSDLHFVEVKNVTLAENGVAMFPDAVTTRGQKHIDELMHLIELGFSAEIVFTIQREDCTSFKTADHIDPEYGKKLKTAIKAGLIVSPYVCSLSDQEILLTNKKL